MNGNGLNEKGGDFSMGAHSRNARTKEDKRKQKQAAKAAKKSARRQAKRLEKKAEVVETQTGESPDLTQWAPF